MDLNSMVSLEPHFFCVVSSSRAACEVLELLPESDLVDQLYYLISTQADILSHIIEGKHFGSNALEEFVIFSEQVANEAIKLKGSAYGEE